MSNGLVAALISFQSTPWPAPLPPFGKNRTFCTPFPPFNMNLPVIQRFAETLQQAAWLSQHPRRCSHSQLNEIEDGLYRCAICGERLYADELD